MSIELPKDAEGREIPLNVDALYDKGGERSAIFAWEYMPRRHHGRWTVRFPFDGSGCKYHPDEYYLAPPDSWEKPDEDLHAVEACGDSPELEDPVRAHAHDIGKKCAICATCATCPNCGGQIDFHAGHIDNGKAFVCEKGKPPMREARYRCRHCDSTIIFPKKCEPEGACHDR